MDKAIALQEGDTSPQGENSKRHENEGKGGGERGGGGRGGECTCSAFHPLHSSGDFQKRASPGLKKRISLEKQPGWLAEGGLLLHKGVLNSLAHSQAQPSPVRPREGGYIGNSLAFLADSPEASCCQIWTRGVVRLFCQTPG